MALDRTWYNSLVNDSGAAIPDGSEVDKAFIDHIYDDVDAEVARLDTKTQAIACLLGIGTAVSWGTGVWADVPDWPIEDYDPLAMHAASSSKIVAPTAGTYGVTAMVVWPPSAVGVRGIVLAVNGVWRTPNLFDLAFNGGTGIGVTSRIMAALRLAANDQVSVQLFHNSGGAELIPSFGAKFQMWRIAL